MSLHRNYLDSKESLIYYPEKLTPALRAEIREMLVRQWGCIAREMAFRAAGLPWDVRNSFDPDRLREAVLAVLEGPLAWRKVPFLPAFDPGPLAHWLDVWDRPDGLYLTLSPEGAANLRVRPSGLWNTDRGIAIEAGEMDAVWDALSGDTAYMPIEGTDGEMHSEWLLAVYPGGEMPLYSWQPDRDMGNWVVYQQFESLDTIGPDTLPSEFSADEKGKLFTREVAQPERDLIGEVLKQEAG